MLYESIYISYYNGLLHPTPLSTREKETKCIWVNRQYSQTKFSSEFWLFLFKDLYKLFRIFFTEVYFDILNNVNWYLCAKLDQISQYHITA